MSVAMCQVMNILCQVSDLDHCEFRFRCHGASSVRISVFFVPLAQSCDMGGNLACAVGQVRLDVLAVVAWVHRPVCEQLRRGVGGVTFDPDEVCREVLKAGGAGAC